MRRSRRKTKKKWLLILLVLALLCAVLLKFVFVVRNVQVQGNPGAVTQESVVRAASIRFGASIFSADTAEIKDRVNATGILKAESVRLRYPDTIKIAVSPRSREAMLLHMGKIRVLDENGCVVENLENVPSEDLVYVSGMQVQGCSTGEVIRADEDQLAAYCAVIQALKNQSAGMYVSELNLSDMHNIQIITRTRITVNMGDARRIPDKIAWMKGAVADLEGRGEYGGTLDVSSGTKADYRSAE